MHKVLGAVRHVAVLAAIALCVAAILLLPDNWKAVAVAFGFAAAIYLNRNNNTPQKPSRPEYEEGSPEPEVSWSADVSVMDSPDVFGYRIFTSAHDEVVSASDLVPKVEARRLRAMIDEEIDRSRDVLAKLETAVSRSNATVPADEARPSAAVTLLIDNSGSMRGLPILVAAACSDMIADTLERHNIPVEILGFTTVSWKGGKSRENWRAAGCPLLPGRLCDLRHIIYKPFQQSLTIARDNLGVMLEPAVDDKHMRQDVPNGILRENVDGEALVWAYKRIEARSEPRKILIVISDGAPVDDSTLSENYSDVLERHLRYVIRDIEKRGKVTLFAIGIGYDRYDVSRYYTNAISVSDPSDLPGALTHTLAKLLTGPTQSLIC